MADLRARKERSEGRILFSQLLRNPYEALLMKLHASLAEATLPGVPTSSTTFGREDFA